MRTFRGRLSARDQAIAVNKALDTWAAGSGREAPQELRNVVAPKANRVKRPVDGRPAAPLERDILADILEALRNDPRIGFVWRQTSGTFQDGDRWIKAGPRGMPDICGFLAGSGRAFFCEVKREGLKPNSRQQDRLDHLKRMGALAGYAWSVETALELLPCGN